MKNANANATVLVVDDNIKFVKRLRSELEEAGYEVMAAVTAARARQMLNKEQIDLAVLDICLDDNNNPHDMSGIEIAMDTDRSIPKLIVTTAPSWEKARLAMKASRGGVPPAVDFLDKNDTNIHRNVVQAVKAAVPVRVFIVHGRDDSAMLAVSELIKGLGLIPVILHEQAWGGRTIIENFERHSRVGFAVALLTPDDVGGLSKQDLRPRARQNVIFELGYFIGRLGRDRVAVLYKEDAEEKDIEIPSDYAGVHYILMDAGRGWRVELAKELKAAKIEVNLNSLIMD